MGCTGSDVVSFLVVALNNVIVGTLIPLLAVKICRYSSARVKMDCRDSVLRQLRRKLAQTRYYSVLEAVLKKHM
jgi:hypothetical protein